MNKERIIEVLNEAVSNELSAIVQYMKHHYEGKGIESPGVLEIFKEIAITEMKHAEILSERITYLGGFSTTRPTPIEHHSTLQEMIEADYNKEAGAIELYNRAIQIAIEEGDITTRRMLEDILADEEGHHDSFGTLLGK